jgi:lipid-A-disaccharide synthase
MKYYIIAGEPSGDLHGSKLIKEILSIDNKAKIRFWGGDLMKNAGGDMVMHYREMAFMGFSEVILNILKILKNFKICKKDIIKFNPDKIILIDYPGFNLRLSKWAKKKGFKNYFYISPQIWAWKEKRAKIIRDYVDELYAVLPFEKDYFLDKHNININFFGHPLMDDFKKYKPKKIESKKPIISILPGSRKQEISKILAKVLKVCKYYPNFRFIIAGVNHINEKTYQKILSDNNSNVEVIYDKTYEIISSSKLSIVTSGTATLETALLNTPQIVCYVTSPLNILLAKLFVKIKFISLVNLICKKEVIKEFIQIEVNEKNLKNEINNILNGKDIEIKKNYKLLRNLIGLDGVSKRVAIHIINN